MKLFETLTDNDNLVILNGGVAGIFSTLVDQNDAWYSSAGDMCNGYYFMRSGNKHISPMYEKYIDLVNTTPQITSSAEQIIGRVIRAKYINKWNKVYNALVENNYSPTDNYSRNESLIGNNSDSTTYGVIITDDGSTSVKETVERDGTNNDDIYGFNSSTPVGDSKNTNNSTVTTTANANDNTTHNQQSKSGTDRKTYNVSETKTISGRDKSAQELIEKELDMRDKQTFYDIVFKDIDSFATLCIY